MQTFIGTFVSLDEEEGNYDLDSCSFAVRDVQASSIKEARIKLEKKRLPEGSHWLLWSIDEEDLCP